MKTSISILNHSMELAIYGKHNRKISFELRALLSLVSKDENAAYFFCEETSPSIDVQIQRTKDDGSEFYSDNNWRIGEMAEWLGFPTDDLISQFHDIIEDIQEMANDINVIFPPALLKAPLRVVK